MHSPDTQRIANLVRRVLRRRKRFILFGLVAVLVPVLLVNLFLPPLYEASTSMVFDEVSAPVASEAEVVSHDILLANRIQELGSFSFCLDIATALPPGLRHKFELPGDLPAGFDTLQTIANILHESIVAAPVQASNVVQVTLQLPSASLVAAVANTAARVYQERNDRIKSQGVGGVRRFLEEQLTRARAELDGSDLALRNYKEQNHITSFDSESQEVLKRATEAEVLINQAHANRNAAEERMNSTQQTLVKQKQSLVPSVTDASSPAVQNLRDRLGQLQAQYVELKLQNYPPNHPKMVELGREIDDTKKDLTDQAFKLANGTSFADPVAQIQKYDTDAVALQIEIESDKAQEAALQRIIEGYNTDLSRLPEKEFQLARLTRERDVNQRSYTTLLEKLDDARIAEAERLPTIRIIDTALVPLEPVRPRPKLYLALGGFLGLLLGAGSAFAVEALRGGVESESELETLTGWPVLGSIPRIGRVSKSTPASPGSGSKETHDTRRLQRGLITKLAPDSGAAEAFRMLRTSLQFHLDVQASHTILVTSVGPGDGKSTTVANLAIALASMGEPVVVVDTEVRRPVQHLLFGVPRGPGLTDVLRESEARPTLRPVAAPQAAGKGDKSTWREADSDPGDLPRVFLEPQKVQAAVVRTTIPNLDVLATGTRVDNPGDRLVRALPAIGALLGELRKDHSFVLLDAPPLLLVHDAALMARLADGVLFIVSSNRAEPELLGRAKQLLTNAGARVIGVALNHVDPGRVYGYGKYYREK